MNEINKANKKNSSAAAAAVLFHPWQHTAAVLVLVRTLLRSVTFERQVQQQQ